MRNRVLLLALLLAACGKKEKPAAPPPSAQEPATAQQPPPPAPPSPAEIEAKREEVKKKRAELQAKIAELEKSKREMDARHEEERKGLPEIAPLRRSYNQAIIDARKKELELERLLERERELKQLAESSVRGKLKELREQWEKVDARRREIQDAWRQSIEAASQGAVEDSPVKKDLDLIRVVKQQWFLATPVARRGEAKESEKKIVNDGFRAWMKEQRERWLLVSKILEQPEAPKGKNPDTYDFTDLKFFILLELMEHNLERQNIAVEKKELSESRVKLDAIQKELDALDEQIRQQMLAGGDELQEYEDLLERKKPLQEAAAYLSTRVTELSSVFKQVDEIKERQDREADDLVRALEDARKALAALR
jgi:hypothetical protein